MNKKKANYSLGAHAKQLLLIALPLLMIQLATLIALILPLEGGELIKNQELIGTFFDGIFRGMIFMLGGVVILDYLEKKDRKKQEK